MAEDRRYRSRRIGLESQGRLDLTNVQETIRASQRLSQNLDRLTKFAFGKLEEKAIREGKQYGVENTPSIEQIADAVYEDKNIDEMFADPNTTFGKAARGVQAATLYQELMNQYNTNAGSVLKSINTRELSSVEEVKQILNANMEGFARVLNQVDPDYAVKFRASAATVGHDIVRQAEKHIQAETLQKTRVDIAEQLDVVKEIYSNAISQSPNPVHVEAKMLVLEANFKSLIAQDPEKETEHLEAFKKVKREVLFDSVADYVISNNLMRDAQKGDFNDFQALVLTEESLSQGTVVELRKHINNRYDEIKTLRNNDIDNNNRLLEETTLPFFIAYDEGKMTYVQLQEELDKQGYVMSPKAKRELASKEKASPEQEDNFNDLMLRINLDKADTDEINNKYINGKITRVQKNKAHDTYIKNVKSLGTGNKIIYKEFKIDEADIRMLDRKNPLKALIAEAELRLQREQTEALEQGVAFNQREAAHRIAQEVKGDYVRAKVPDVFKKTKSRLDYYYDHQVVTVEDFLALSEEDIKNLPVKKKGANQSKLIEYHRRLKSYQLGVIPDDDE
jgi:hypothetical protein